MTLKNDEKFEEEYTCCFKIKRRNLTNFDLCTRKSQKFTVYNVCAKKVQRSYLS